MRRFLAQQSVATLFRIGTTLFQRWNSVLRYKSSLRIVPCNITLKIGSQRQLISPSQTFDKT